MNYNAEGLAKNPKSPTHRCSNQNCKFEFDRKTNQWVPSKFITSEWDNANSNQMNITPALTPTPTPTPTLPTPVTYQNEDTKWNAINAKKEDGMKKLNAINNACLLIANGKEELKNIQELSNKIYSLVPVKFASTPVTPPAPEPVIEPVNDIQISDIPF